MEAGPPPPLDLFSSQFLVSVSKENSSASEVLDSLSQSVHVKPENLRLAEARLSLPGLSAARAHARGHCPLDMHTSSCVHTDTVACSWGTAGVGAECQWRPQLPSCSPCGWWCPAAFPSSDSVLSFRPGLPRCGAPALMSLQVSGLVFLRGSWLAPCRALFLWGQAEVGRRFLPGDPL